MHRHTHCAFYTCFPAPSWDDRTIHGTRTVFLSVQQNCDICSERILISCKNIDSEQRNGFCFILTGIQWIMILLDPDQYRVTRRLMHDTSFTLFRADDLWILTSRIYGGIEAQQNTSAKCFDSTIYPKICYISPLIHSIFRSWYYQMSPDSKCNDYSSHHQCLAWN